MKIRRIEADYVALGIIAVCLLLIGLNELFNPAKIIERAVERSVCQYTSRETANTPFLNTEAFDMAETDSATVKAEVNITNGSAEGTGIDFVLDRNASKNIAQAKFNLKYMDAAALGINAYTDNKNVTVSAPVLYDKNLLFNINDFSKRIYDAVGIQYDENEVQNVFFDTKAQNNTYSTAYSGILKGFKASGRKAWIKVSRNVELSSIKGEELKDFDKGYMLNMSAEDTRALYEAFGEELFSNTDFKNSIGALAENEFRNNSYIYMMYGINDPQQVAELMLKSYQNMYEHMTGIYDNSVIEAGDATILVYINDGMVVSSQIATYFTAQGQQLDVNLNADFNGDVNPADSLEVKFSALSQGAGYTVFFNDINRTDGNMLTTSKGISIDDTAYTTVCNFNTAYDRENNGYTVAFSVNSGDENVISLTSEGTILSDKNSYVIEADSIKKVVEGTELLAADGSFSIMPLENEITPIEGEGVDLLNISQEERNTIIDTVQNKLSEISNKIQR